MHHKWATVELRLKKGTLQLHYQDSFEHEDPNFGPFGLAQRVLQVVPENEEVAELLGLPKEKSVVCVHCCTETLGDRGCGPSPRPLLACTVTDLARTVMDSMHCHLLDAPMPKRPMLPEPCFSGRATPWLGEGPPPVTHSDFPQIKRNGGLVYKTRDRANADSSGKPSDRGSEEVCKVP